MSLESSRASLQNIRASFSRRGMTISEVEAIPLATNVETSEDELTVSLADGRRISVPLAWFPRLLDASADERAEYRLIGGGEGIHWPQVDEDISVVALLRGSPTRSATARQNRVRDLRASVVQYRRGEHGDTWHWCSRCSTYPSENYFVRTSRPRGELCNECLVKSKTEQC